jgi:hypothetical protein
METVLEDLTPLIAQHLHRVSKQALVCTSKRNKELFEFEDVLRPVYEMMNHLILKRKFTAEMLNKYDTMVTERKGKYYYDEYGYGWNCPYGFINRLKPHLSEELKMAFLQSHKYDIDAKNLECYLLGGSGNCEFINLEARPQNGKLVVTASFTSNTPPLLREIIEKKYPHLLTDPSSMKYWQKIRYPWKYIGVAGRHSILSLKNPIPDRCNRMINGGARKGQCCNKKKYKQGVCYRHYRMRNKYTSGR